MGFSTTHLIIFLVIIVVIFGTKKLRNIGSDLGGAVKGFKRWHERRAPKSQRMPCCQRASAGGHDSHGGPRCD